MKNKRLNIVLLASVLLNVFFIGHGITFFLMGPPPHHDPMSRIPSATKHLVAEHQETIRNMWSETQKQMETKMDDMFLSMKEARAILIAPDFDEVALEKLHQEIEGKDQEIKTLLADTLKKTAKVLPDEERITFFKEILPQDFPHPPPPPAPHRDH